ncbi:MAG: DUF1801 domain-containing protein [Micrococcus sp.]|nr:DUF1801 domain-containing protein [Micrococcus sp.]
MTGTDSTSAPDPAGSGPTGPGAEPSAPSATPSGSAAAPTGSAAVDAYIAGFPDVARALLTELRELARATVPEATETLKWNASAYVHPRGTILFQLSGHQAHASMVFTPSVREAFEDELVNFETGKGSVKLFYGQPAPHDVLERMMLARLREYEDEGVTWM